LTSIVGVIAYAVLSLRHSGSIAPNWVVGLSMGAGGLLGGFLGAGLQSRLPELVLRRVLGLLALALGVRYVVIGLT
jgi:uncharacterized membrane protein YfcA